MVVGGILWVMRTGSSRREMPEEFGKWERAYQRQSGAFGSASSKRSENRDATGRRLKEAICRCRAVQRVEKVGTEPIGDPEKTKTIPKHIRNRVFSP
jgi:transposase